MNKELIIEKLKEHHYPEQMYASMLRKIEIFDPNLSYDFKKWVIDDVIPNVKREGYSFESLTVNYDFNPINAFVILDWLRREPESARAAIENGIK